MKFKITCNSYEDEAHFLTTLYQLFTKITIQSALTKFEQFSKCSFEEILSQHLTVSPYIWN